MVINTLKIELQSVFYTGLRKDICSSTCPQKKDSTSGQYENRVVWTVYSGVDGLSTVPWIVQGTTYSMTDTPKNHDANTHTL